MTTHATYTNAASWLLDRNIDDGRGGNIAFRCEGVDATYDDVLASVFRVQNGLRRLDVRRGERVALVLNDDLNFPAWFLGCLRSGVVPVPLSTMSTADDLGAIVADAGAGVVVLSDTYAGHAATIETAAPDLRHTIIAGAGDNDLLADATEVPVAATVEDSPAFWLYSSGTTGTPKGVMHRHGSLRATAETYGRDILAIRPEDRCHSIAKLFFAFGLGNSLTFPMAVGATSILNPGRPTPPDVLKLLADEQPSLFFASPGFVAALLDAGEPASTFSSIRATITAGESLPADLQRRFADLTGAAVLDGIGTTEALHIFLSNRPGKERAGTSGTPVDGYEARLVDDDDNLVTDADTPGYLQVKGPSLATGYWSKDAATRNAFRGWWLQTGDVYTRSADGYWTFLGRNNDMIKAGGIWVSPAEVESALIEHESVLEAAVVGARNDDGLEETVAFVVARSGQTIDEAALDAHCRDRMAAFKRPRRIIAVDELPKTATGKVRRFQLRDQLDS